MVWRYAQCYSIWMSSNFRLTDKGNRSHNDVAYHGAKMSSLVIINMTYKHLPASSLEEELGLTCMYHVEIGLAVTVWLNNNKHTNIMHS